MSVDVGKALDGAVIKQDTYVWLSRTKIACTNNGQPLTGEANCELSFSQNSCQPNDITRQAFLNDKGATCIKYPLVWDAKTA